jgi:uncharacterized protein
MRCTYCYSPPKARHDMSFDILHKSILFAAENCGQHAGFVFFGGEPLLRKDLIEAGIIEALNLRKAGKFLPHFKVSTNGLLLDPDFLDFANIVGLSVALSIDGISEAHNYHRKTCAQRPTFETILDKLHLLLHYQPFANILMTVTPETVQFYHDSVDFLFEQGVKYLIVSLNYAGNWNNKSISELQNQYRKIAMLYESLTLKNKKFYFSPFETKFETHIKADDSNYHKCAFSERQLSVAPDGKLYPCIQFVRDGISNTSYSIGNIFNGIDLSARSRLLTEVNNQNKECFECLFAKRCNNDCNCLNWQTTGSLSGISPVLCETERILIPIVDKLGERLFKKRAPLFIQKHYNEIYPYLSLMEENLIGCRNEEESE